MIHSTHATEQAALRALQGGYGADAQFRRGQLESITAVAGRRQRLLLVQRTGWGKSVVYFVATKLLRDNGYGPTVIVSPLLALMRDQIAAARRMGLNAVTINSSNRSDWEDVKNELLADGADLLLVSPERFNNEQFRSEMVEVLFSRAGLLVIDEAHCISDWGHDFRPDYRRLSRLIGLLPPGVPVLATTATANDRVVGDIEAQFGQSLTVIRGPLNRDSLALHALNLPTRAQRMAWLAANVPELPGTGIVYCMTVGDVDMLTSWFESNAIPAMGYHGSSEPADRLVIEQALHDNSVKVVCATSALGMGFDKPDLGFVVHFQTPSSPVAYYQQVGRAGRALERAVAVLMAGKEDQAIWHYLLEASLPLQEHAKAIVDVLAENGDWMRLQEIEGLVNIRRSRLEGILKILDVEGAVERTGSRYRRTLASWTFDADRVARVRGQRVAEQKAMLGYFLATRCRMRYLQEQLDDPTARDCGQCDNCTGSPLSSQVPPAEVARADEFLRRLPVSLEPRKQWPGVGKTGQIPADERCEIGRSLGRLGDGAWGDLTLRCKQEGQPFPAEMLDAMAAMIQAWSPDPVPTWITYVPSLDPSRQMVPELARGLADRLGWPVVPALIKTRPNNPQKLQQNSAQQYANVANSFEVSADLVRSTPVLLVDDIADSGWTLTVIGSQLRKAGSGLVVPATLAGSRR